MTNKSRKVWMLFSGIALLPIRLSLIHIFTLLMSIIVFVITFKWTYKKILRTLLPPMEITLNGYKKLVKEVFYE